MKSLVDQIEENKKQPVVEKVSNEFFDEMNMLSVELGSAKVKDKDAKAMQKAIVSFFAGIDEVDEKGALGALDKLAKLVRSKGIEESKK